MSESERLNGLLAAHAPGVLRCLSPLGRQAAFPKGIPFQAASAKGTRFNATIGQMTDGDGSPLPLSVLEEAIGDLDPKMSFLYAPVDGHKDVRKAWMDREQRLGGSELPVALPVATHGLTHGLSVLATLFGDPDTTLIVPTPFWGNYRLVFTMNAGCKLDTFDFFKDGGFNLQGLADALDRVPGKSIVLLNLPGNPTGYALSPEEAVQLCEIVKNHRKPTVFAVDDAYQGFIYDRTRHLRSEFWDLAEVIDPELHALFKIDGATKELLFFGSRLGFVTHPHLGAEDAITSKLKYVIRGTVGSPPGPSQALVLRALQHPEIESAFEARFEIMQRRWRALTDAVNAMQSDKLVPYPFNAAFFMLFALNGSTSDSARRKLIEEASVGTIAFSEPNALRVAFCSVSEQDIPEMVDRIARVVG